MKASILHFKAGALCRLACDFHCWKNDLSIPVPVCSFPKRSVGYAKHHDASWCVKFELKAGTVGLVLRGFTALKPDGSFGYIEVLLGDGEHVRMYSHPSGNKAEKPEMLFLEPVEP